MKWISVEDRLPEDDEGQVLAIVNGKHGNINFVNGIVMAEYFNSDKEWILEMFPEIRNPNVTHWQPLPEPPKED